MELVQYFGIGKYLRPRNGHHITISLSLKGMHMSKTFSSGLNTQKSPEI
jgi:hypothetical protein